jgi:hypothetical protein
VKNVSVAHSIAHARRICIFLCFVRKTEYPRAGTATPAIKKKCIKYLNQHKTNSGTPAAMTHFPLASSVVKAKPEAIMSKMPDIEPVFSSLIDEKKGVGVTRSMDFPNF